jgi:hypothetical protein
VVIEEARDFNDVALGDRFVGTGTDEGKDGAHGFPCCPHAAAGLYLKIL